MSEALISAVNMPVIESSGGIYGIEMLVCQAIVNNTYQLKNIPKLVYVWPQEYFMTVSLNSDIRLFIQNSGSTSGNNVNFIIDDNGLITLTSVGNSRTGTYFLFIFAY